MLHCSRIAQRRKKGSKEGGIRKPVTSSVTSEHINFIFEYLQNN